MEIVQLIENEEMTGREEKLGISRLIEKLIRDKLSPLIRGKTPGLKDEFKTL
jgi:hypothetical protein